MISIGDLTVNQVETLGVVFIALVGICWFFWTWISKVEKKVSNLTSQKIEIENRLIKIEVILDQIAKKVLNGSYKPPE